MNKIIIGITDCSKWKNYHDWFASGKVKVLKLSSKDNNVQDVDRCDGIVLSGGEDVHPKFYGKPSYWKKRKALKLEVNEARDRFELKVIERAIKKKKPLLGICRGLQIANVYFGGTLIPDLPLFKGEAVRHSRKEGYDQTHTILVLPDSDLNGMVKLQKGICNSAHHQAADRIGKGLRVSALSEDGTVECIERNSPKGKPFLLLVQWHPERIKDQSNSLSKNIKKEFLSHLIKK
jgi:putative glutamine amidotransferase